MPSVVYALCALESVFCAVLLIVSYQRTRARVLLWVALCFCGLTVNNALLFLDLVVVPTVDLSLPRAVSSAVAVVLLLVGLIWDGA